MNIELWNKNALINKSQGLSRKVNRSVYWLTLNSNKLDEKVKILGK